MDQAGMQLMSQGAEACVYETSFNGRPAVMKHRFEKRYRHATLDERIRGNQMRGEARCLLRAMQLGIRVPIVVYSDAAEKKLWLERIPGPTVKQFLRDHQADATAEARLAVAVEVGKTLAALHDGNIIHGDLTTSNMILRDGDISRVTMIDFGLSYQSTTDEDKAVDLYVMERAITSTHVECQDVVDQILATYAQVSVHATATLRRLQQVRARGRKRTMVG